MKIDSENTEELLKLLNYLIQRVKDERLSSAAVASETLAALNLSIDAMPQRCQRLIQQCALLQLKVNQPLDPLDISVRQSREISARLTQELELLELKQKNAELQRQVDRNNVVLEGLKRELQSARESLANQSPNPDTVYDHVRQVKQKLASYEEVYQKALVKFTKLHIPDCYLPASIEELALRLAMLQVEEETLRQRAQDITLARQARDTLSKLARG